MSKKKGPTQYQKEKNGFLLSFKDIQLSTKQQELFNTILDNRITIVTGPAGSAKTFVACYASLKLLEKSKVKKIILTKPTETIGSHDLGALPGELDEKIAIYQECFIHNFLEIANDKDVKALFFDKIIEFKPTQYMRGVTFNNCVVIIDEFQTYDLKELMAIVTRLGKNSIMIFAGDVSQNDINKKYMGLQSFLKILDGITEVSHFQFNKTDIVRDPLLIQIVDNYEKLIESESAVNKKNT